MNNIVYCLEAWFAFENLLPRALDDSSLVLFKTLSAVIAAAFPFR